MWIYKVPKTDKFCGKWEKGYKITKILGPDSYWASNGEHDLRVNRKHIKMDTQQN